MKDIFDQIKDLFKDPSDPALPFVHESLTRSDKEVNAYRKWLFSDSREVDLNRLKKLYSKTKQNNQGAGLRFVLVEGKSTSGFILNSTDKKIPPFKLPYFFDYFRDVVREQNYRLYLSDRKASVKNKKVEITERHFLKPKPAYEKNDRGQKVFIQGYGNITIELIKINNVSQYLKFFCSHYDDHKYKSPLPFEHLMEKILY